MENQELIDAKRYLVVFDKILSKMADKLLVPRGIKDINSYFIKCMVIDHRAVIYMFYNILKYTDNKELVSFIEGCIEIYTKRVALMKEMIRGTDDYYNSPRDIFNYIKKYFTIVKNMLFRMKNSERGENLERNFISELLPHHEGSIAMCENLLIYNISPRLKEVVNDTIITQGDELRELLNMQRKIFC